MYCVGCGSKIGDNAKFCSNCGEKVEQQKKALFTKQLRCENCHGAMIVDGDQPVLLFPYCGSRELILEDDKVTIQRIKSNTEKEIEFEKQRTIRDIKLEKRKIEYKENLFVGIIAAVFFLLLIIMIRFF